MNTWKKRSEQKRKNIYVYLLYQQNMSGNNGKSYQKMLPLFYISFDLADNKNIQAFVSGSGCIILV